MENLTLQQAKEKFGDKNIRKIFEIQIYDRMYPVYSIDDYEHQLGKANGCPDTWWLDYSIYHNDGDVEQLNIRELIPYIDKGVHRICWEVNYRQTNTTKYKWDEWDIRSGGVCIIKANSKEIYKFNYSDISGALSRVQSKIDDMIYHPFNFINPEEENGRKIWYYGLPAKIKLGYDVGEIIIEPDYSYITPKEWWEELEKRKTKIQPNNNSSKIFDNEEDEMLDNRFLEDKNYGTINHGDVFYDGMINWFRD